MLYEHQQVRDDDDMEYGSVRESEKQESPFDPTSQHYEPFQHDYGRYPNSFKKYEKSFEKYEQYKEYFKNTPQEYPNFIDFDKEYNKNDSFFKRKF